MSWKQSRIWDNDPTLQFLGGTVDDHQTVSRRGFLQLCAAAGFYCLLPAPLRKMIETGADDAAFLRETGAVDCARTDIKTACLTYDDQISPHRIDRINRLLDALKDANARAAFFFTGKDSQSNSDFKPYAKLIARILEDGHNWGCHGWYHEPCTATKTNQLKAEIEKWLAAAAKIVPGYPVRYFRPPYGDVNQRVINLVADYDLQVVLWNVESGGHDQRTFEHVQTGVRRKERLGHGPLILSHMTRHFDVNHAAQITAWLAEEGYTLSNLDDGIPRTMVRPSLREEKQPDLMIKPVNIECR
ncbi:MAG: polysaccharide deacetylase family protein [Bellilinea sp.]